VDYNRSGNPLCEVVTMPDLESPGEARDFMKQLISVLQYLGIYDDSCILKADANVSIKETGYVRAEIKNISGFKEIERALRYEVERQRRDTKEVVQETRAWDSDAGITRPLRKKETEEDYGYIVEPDLVATRLDQAWVAQVRSSIPELAREKAARLAAEHGIKPDDAAVISSQMELAVLYEKVAAEVDPVLAAKWLRRELVRVMNYNSLEFKDLKLDAGHLVDLLKLIQSGEITDTVGQKIIELLVVEPFDIRSYVEKEGLRRVSDPASLEALARRVISENSKVVEDYKSGNERSLNYLVGQVMRLSKGTAAPQKVRDMIKSALDG
jgi:aspartyl-tRNA(Asn)/glutamyl-tRNA(Gln) amidotransferase subunit B